MWKQAFLASLQLLSRNLPLGSQNMRENVRRNVTLGHVRVTIVTMGKH